MDDRLYPARPILAASIAVFRDGRVLLARRGRAPMAGVYSLPGGAVEVGETLREAALRELKEEVGVEADILAFVDHVEPIAREGDRVRAHFVVAAFVGRWRRGEARAGPEAEDVAWIDPAAIGDYPTTPSLPAIVAKAAALERSSEVKRLVSLFAAVAALTLLSQPLVAQTAAPAKPAARVAVPTPAPSQAPAPIVAPPPYEPQLLRLAEIIGALAYLRDLCGDGDGDSFAPSCPSWSRRKGIRKRARTRSPGRSIAAFAITS